MLYVKGALKMIQRIGHVTIEVPVLEEAVEFYESFIGVRLVEQVGETAYLSCNDRHHELILAQSPERAFGLVDVGLEVQPGTLEDCVEKALRAGATAPVELSEPGVARAVVLQAPLGFRIKLFDGMQKIKVPDRPTVGVPERFGHINLTMPEIDAWGVFLEEGLGFGQSDRAYDAGGTVISWYHCQVPGADHHGIANTRSPDRQLHHIKWEYRTVAEVVDLVDRYCEHDRTLVWGMGRHGVDRSLFSYVEDPVGLMNEVGLGMLKIGESPHWTGPSNYAIDDPKAVNLWGSQIPEPWLVHGIPLAKQLASRSA
jgi:catechol 2,3-dioxygenase-like lactoylglutathione lyase family enzyme